MSAAMILRRAYGDSVYKRAAEDFGVTRNAIRWWIKWGFPKGRAEQVQRILSARIEAQIEEDRRTLELIRGAWNSDAKSRSSGGVGAAPDRVGVHLGRQEDRRKGSSP